MRDAVMPLLHHGLHGISLLDILWGCIRTIRKADGCCQERFDACTCMYEYVEKSKVPLCHMPTAAVREWRKHELKTIVVRHACDP